MPLRLLLPLLLVVGCQIERTDRADDAESVSTAPLDVEGAARALGPLEPEPTPAAEEAARRDTSWRAFARRDDGQPPAPSDDGGSRADTAAYARALALPLAGAADSTALLYAQILLDRAGFSPGQVDGLWGQNTEKAIHWLQRAAGLDATGRLDRATLGRLVRMADAPARPDSLLATVVLSAEDVEGPFEPLPEDVYERAEMERLYYTSLAEALGERYHASPDLLRRLNPGRPLDSLRAGDSLRVPAVGAASERPQREVERIVISDGGRYLHALDGAGRIAYHFPATLGAEYDPSPSDTLSVTNIAPDPSWHYQPDILADVPDSAEEAVLPPGPNNAVGVVWMQLSKEHYGIHGTSAPGTIGHVSSAGCVRLTNWDAAFLADRIEPGIEVAFRDTSGRGPAERPPLRSAAPAASGMPESERARPSGG